MNLQSPAITSVHANPIHRNGKTRLHHYGVIKAEGQDAAKFLHGQLTQDFALLGTDAARLAALCSPKGRMLASFVGFKQVDGAILLICSRDILESTLKRLSMFVMRAKVTLSDATYDYPVWGLVGEAATNVFPESQPMWSKLDIDGASAVQLCPAQGLARVLWISHSPSEYPNAPEVPTSIWNWLEVQSGITTVSAMSVDKYVPQMLNYESVGGVSFKKGCYPGQEVVARSQFRGTLKRRAFLIHCDSQLDCGSEIFTNAEDTEPVATVVQAAVSEKGGFDAIASGNIGALGDATLHLDAHDGPRVTLLPLPYPLLEDI